MKEIKHKTKIGDELPLSKWWTTPSAQAAFARAKQQRDERIAKVRAAFAARKEQAKREVENWKVVPV